MFCLARARLICVGSRGEGDDGVDPALRLVLFAVGVGRPGRVDGAGLDVLGEGDEGQVHVVVGLGRGLQELNVVFVGKSLAPGSIYNLLVLHVTLVADQHLVHGLCGMLLDVADPVADVGEGLFVSDVVHQQDAHGSSVVCGGDRAEALLSGSVPDL